jgi:hypothetical protein
MIPFGSMVSRQSDNDVKEGNMTEVTEAAWEARLRRLAAMDGRKFVKLRGKNPTGNYGPARYLLVDPNTSTWLAEWPSLEAAKTALLQALIEGNRVLTEALVKAGVLVPEDK